jgi:hypothetical protein
MGQRVNPSKFIQVDHALSQLFRHPNGCLPAAAQTRSLMEPSAVEPYMSDGTAYVAVGMGMA